MVKNQKPAPAYLYCDASNAWHPIDAPGTPPKGSPLFIAMRDGEPWFAATKLCASLGVDPARAAGLLEKEDIFRMMIDAENGLSLVSEYGFHVLAGNMDCLSQEAPAHPLHRWVVKSLLPAVRKAAQPAVPDPAEIATNVFADFAQKKLSGSRQRLGAAHCARLLAHLWQDHSNGQWVSVHKPGKLELSEKLGVSPRSLGRALEYLVGWGVVERRSDTPERQSREWPDRIRLNPSKIQEALSGFGLELPAPDTTPADTRP